MRVKGFFDKRTYTITYVVWDPDSRDAVVIDPVWDFDPIAVALYTESQDWVEAFIDRESLRVAWVLETHAHADHLTGSQLLKNRYDAKVAIGAGIIKVQEAFKSILDLPSDFSTDGSQFDRLLLDKEVLEAGTLRVEVLETPGHTPACLTYKIEDAIFTGDAIFMPDYGTGRCDFPAGSAESLYDSITESLYTLPDETRVYVGHDYQPGGRDVRFETTIGQSKRENIQLPETRSREEFVRFRTERDTMLSPPKLLFQSIQINIDGGQLPAPAENGRRYLKLPIGLFD